MFWFSLKKKSNIILTLRKKSPVGFFFFKKKYYHHHFICLNLFWDQRRSILHTTFNAVCERDGEAGSKWKDGGQNCETKQTYVNKKVCDFSFGKEKKLTPKRQDNFAVKLISWIIFIVWIYNIKASINWSTSLGKNQLAFPSWLEDWQEQYVTLGFLAI